MSNKSKRDDRKQLRKIKHEGWMHSVLDRDCDPDRDSDYEELRTKLLVALEEQKEYGAW